MRKIRRIKGEEKLKAQQQRSSVLTFADPGAAAAYAAQEAFAAGVMPSAVMYSSPDGAGNGGDVEASEAVSVAPAAPVTDEEVQELTNAAPPAEIVAPEIETVTPEDDVEIETPEVEVETSDPVPTETKDVAPELAPGEAMEQLAVAEDSDPVNEVSVDTSSED